MQFCWSMGSQAAHEAHGGAISFIATLVTCIQVEFCVRKRDKKLLFCFMARRRLSEGQKWQIIGMRNAGLSCRDIGTRLWVNHTVVSRLVLKHGLTGQVKDRPRSGRPR